MHELYRILASSITCAIIMVGCVVFGLLNIGQAFGVWLFASSIGWIISHALYKLFVAADRKLIDRRAHAVKIRENRYDC